jgi:hypothetical protein
MSAAHDPEIARVVARKQSHAKRASGPTAEAVIAQAFRDGVFEYRDGVIYRLKRRFNGNVCYDCTPRPACSLPKWRVALHDYRHGKM